MRKLVVCLLIVFVLSFASSYSNADEDKPMVEEKAEDKAQTKPAKKYDLTPKFYKNMTWKEDVNLKLVIKSSDYQRIDESKLSAKVKVSELKNNKPLKIDYEDFGGKEIRTSTYEDETDSDESDIIKQNYTFMLDEKFKFTVDTEVKRLDEEFFSFYPSGNFMGFDVPVDAKSVGDKWTSDTLNPINFDIIADEFRDEVTIIDLKSEFEFVSVSQSGSTEIAKISWTGSFTFSEMDGDDDGKFKWKREIKFDLTNRRLLSTKGKIEVDVEDEGRALEISLERKLDYGSEGAKKDDKKPEIKPKNDDE